MLRPSLAFSAGGRNSGKILLQCTMSPCHAADAAWQAFNDLP
jgi:hypothetical protein